MSKVALKYLFKKLHSKLSVLSSTNAHMIINTEISHLSTLRSNVKVIHRKGVNIFVTVNNSVEWERKRMIMIDNQQENNK